MIKIVIFSHLFTYAPMHKNKQNILEMQAQEQTLRETANRMNQVINQVLQPGQEFNDQDIPIQQEVEIQGENNERPTNDQHVETQEDEEHEDLPIDTAVDDTVGSETSPFPECPICYEPIKTIPVYGCHLSNEHFFCYKCRGHLANCPWDRSNMILNSNLTMTELE